MANMVTGVISITVSAVILANVFISTIKGVNNSYTCSAGDIANGTCAQWTASELAMWGLLTLLGIVGLLYGVLSVFGLA